MPFRLSRWLSYAALSIPFLLLGFYLWRFTVNAPYHDDYDWAVLFLNDFLHSESIWAKLKLIFTYHCEHRIVYARSAILSYFYSTNTMNFKHLAIFGNLWLFATPLLFYRAFKTASTNIFYFLPILFLFLNLQCFPNLFTTFGLTNNTSLFFILLALYILNYYDTQIATFIAFSLGIFVTFIAANGMFVWPLGVFVLFLKSRYRLSIFWAIVAILSISAYFLIEKQYWKIDFVGPRPLWIIIVNTPIYLPTFLLSVLDVNQVGGKLYSMFAVFCLGLIAAYYGWKNKKELQNLTSRKTIQWLQNLTPDQRFLLSAIGLVLITAILCLVYRSGLGFNKWVIKDRYRIYSQLFWVCIYIWGLQILPNQIKRKWQRGSLVICTIIWVGSYFFITPQIKAFSKQNYDDLKYFVSHGMLKYYDYHKEADRQIATNKSILYLSERGILHLPPKQTLIFGR
jgi:hypothetical protein